MYLIYLEGSLKTIGYPFSHMASPRMAFWQGLQCQSWVFFSEASFKSNQKVVGGGSKMALQMKVLFVQAR